MRSPAPALLPLDPSGPGLASALAELGNARDLVRSHLKAGSLAQLSDSAAAEAALLLHGIEDSTAAFGALVLDRVNRSGYAAGAGFLSAGTWLRVKARISQPAAAGRVRHAERMTERYPAVMNAWLVGRITGEHARVAGPGLDQLCAKLAKKIKREHADAGTPLTPVELAERVAQSRPAFESTFLDLALRHGPEVLRTGLTRALEHVDPDGAAQDEMDAFDEQSLKIKQVGGMAVTTIHSTREVAAQFRTLLDHHRSTLHRTGTAAPDPADVDPVTGKETKARQQHLDALAFGELVQSMLDAGVGSGKQGERPHLDLTVSLIDLQHLRGTATLPATGDHIPGTSAARIACDADVTLFTTTGIHRDPQTGQIIDPVLAKLLAAPPEIVGYGRRERIVPADLRRALAVRDQGCAFAGCHRPVRHTEAHHVIPWVAGGLTELANCVLLCSRHHHYVHEGGWTIKPRDGMSPTMPGYWAFAPPDPAQR